MAISGTPDLWRGASRERALRDPRPDVGELERAGLVVRVADGKDRRRAKIELSPHGRLAVEGFLSDYFASGRTDAAARTGK